MVWWTNREWVFGVRKTLGKGVGWISVDDDVASPELGTRCWKAYDGTGKWVEAPDLHIYTRPAPPAAEPEVEVTGGRTRADKDVELRKRAIDLEADTPRKRSRTEQAQLEARVAKARSATDGAIAARVKAILAPAFDEYADGQIDAAELDRRRIAARAQAAAEHQGLSALDAAFDAYQAAVRTVRAREAAWAAYGKAAHEEEAAEAELNKALAALEPSPSGAVKAEA